ncbi:MAG: hypothetical protein KIT74_08770 [Fimbriimonadales bacterium]|nr:hypothetical protein [Fimbriimonadales bacterium]
MKFVWQAFCVFAALSLLASTVGCGTSENENVAPPPESPISDQSARPIGAPRVATEAEEPKNMVTYSAKQVGNKVTIVATGENPTGGWKNELIQRLTKIWPPEFELKQTPPEGPATQALTPFTVEASFEASEKVTAVRVFDQVGRHEVMVIHGD